MADMNHRRRVCLGEPPVLLTNTVKFVYNSDIGVYVCYFKLVYCFVADTDISFFVILLNLSFLTNFLGYVLVLQFFVSG